MSRRTDLEESIRESYNIIREYEAIIRTSDRPEEKARARRAVQEQWGYVEGYLAEYRAVVGDALPEEIAQIAAHFSSLVELSKVEQAMIDTREGLRGVLPDGQIEATLAPLREKQASIRARLWGDGIIAQGGSTVATGQGLAIGGNVSGGVVHTVIQQPVIERMEIMTSQAGPRPQDLRRRYLVELAREANRLPWTTVERDYADPERGEGLGLAEVYTALDTTELERVEREEELRRLMDELERGDARRVAAQEVVNRETRLVVLGDPGAGKSTFVRYLTYVLAQGGIAPDPIPWLERMAPWDHGPLLPVRVELRAPTAEVAKQTGGTAALFLRHLRQTLAAWQLDDFWPLLEQAIRDEKESLLVLLDGLDEVPAALRGTVVEAVQDMADRYRRHRYVVTCRPYAYVGQPCRLRGFREVTLAPFDEHQVDDFVATWYRELARRGRLSAQEAEGRAGQLQRAVRGRDLWGLAQRPLLLTVMTLLHTFRGQLPEDRTELYADAVDLLLRRWEGRMGVEDSVLEQLNIPGLKMSDLEAGLYEVAFRAHSGIEETQRTADVDEADLRKWLAPYMGGDWNKAGEFVAYIRERAGLLVRHKSEAYTFPHRTFQEFMTACHLVGLRDYPGEAAQLVRNEPDRWREVFVLAAGHAARTHRLGQAIGAVNALCPREVSEVSRLNAVAFRWAQLAGESLLEIGLIGVRREEVGRAVLERVQGWLVAGMQADGVLEPGERVAAGNVLAQLGDPRFRADAGDPAGRLHLPDEPLLGFVKVPAGPFLMGSDRRRDPAAPNRELPQHTVELPTYYVARCPVTVAQFRAFVENSGYKPRDEDSLRGIDNHPVVNVTWYDAVAYCKWLTESLCEWRDTPELPVTLLRNRGWQVRLPSEAEWEKAARGTDGRIFPWGGSADPNRANYIGTGIGATSAVGCFPGGASPYGVLDMSGNVWEWTRSLHKSYPYDPEDGREDLSAGGARVLRGGSFYNASRYGRCACRFGFYPDDWYWDLGFRVVVSPGFHSGL